MGNPLPPVLIFPSDGAGAGSRHGCRLKGTWVLGVNHFASTTQEAHPGICTVFINGVEHQGRCYCSKSGGITDEILEAIIEDMIAPRFPDRCAERPIVILADGHKTRFALNVLQASKRNHVRIIMGVPNATHIWQVPDIYNNGVFKILWVKVKRWWILQKSLDRDNRVPEGEKDKITFNDIVILFNIVFPRAFGQREMNMKAIEKSGLVPFTRCLLEHPIVLKNSEAGSDARIAETDTIIQNLGDKIPHENLRRIYDVRDAMVAVRRRKRHQQGIILPDYHGEDASVPSVEEQERMRQTRHTAGGFFSMGEVEFTGTAVFNKCVERTEEKKRNEDEAKEKLEKRKQDQEVAQKKKEDKIKERQKKLEDKALKQRVLLEIDRKASDGDRSGKKKEKF